MIRASEVRLGTSASVAPSVDLGDDNELSKILSIADLKAEDRIRHDEHDDTLLPDAIREAYSRIDGPYGLLNRAILTQTWVGTIDQFDDHIELPLPPLQSVTSINYQDTNDTQQTLSTDVYGVRTGFDVGYIYRKKDQSWPDLYGNPGDIEITFVCGYGDASDVLTKAYNIRKILKWFAMHYYRNPTPVFEEPRVVEVPRILPFGIKHLVDQYRIVNDHA